MQWAVPNGDTCAEKEAASPCVAPLPPLWRQHYLPCDSEEQSHHQHFELQMSQLREMRSTSRGWRCVLIVSPTHQSEPNRHVLEGLHRFASSVESACVALSHVPLPIPGFLQELLQMPVAPNLQNHLRCKQRSRDLHHRWYSLSTGLFVFNLQPSHSISNIIQARHSSSYDLMSRIWCWVPPARI